MAVEKKEKYYEAVGRRKTAIARVRIVPKSKVSISINGNALDTHFPIEAHQYTVRSCLDKISQKFAVEAKITGGGQTAQSEAMRLGLARALVVYDSELRKEMKEAGFLRRDARVKERKKFGLRKARRAPQWSKR